MNQTTSKYPSRSTKKIPFDIQSTGKVPPHALDLEMAVLGALMLEKEALSRVIDIIKPEIFYAPKHKIIFEAILTLFQNSEPIDLLTVTNQLKLMGKLDEVEGPYYIAKLTSQVASAANIEFHARIVAQKYLQRELIQIAGETLRDAYEDTTDVFDLLDRTEQALFSLSETNLRRNYSPMNELVIKTIKRLEEIKGRGDGITGIPSGFRALDQLTAGWQPSSLIIIAARPAMGKTAFVLSVARNAAVLYKKPVAFFSLEMAAIELSQRLICAEAELDAQKVRTGNLEDYEWEQLNAKVGELSKAPLYIDDTPALSLFDLRTKCRRLKAEKNIELVIIDYLQLMRGDVSKSGNREQEIAGISRALKELAKELNVPVIALSQLSRAVESRGGDKKPMLSDLRESGSIEQDADMVMFLYRPEYYGFQTLEDGTPTEGICQVIIGKQRHGPVG
ncbi:MAG: replicative DNA helicase, partial [Bacteroidia bacterium]|nr:replicative DNA helicase [Bacteroidia bacterium]